MKDTLTLDRPKPVQTSAPEKNSPKGKFIFISALILCLSPFVSAPVALLIGIVVANVSGHPFLHLNQRVTSMLLQISVVGLGFGMNLSDALTAGKEGLLFTVVSIISTLLIGAVLGKWMCTEKKTSHLISCGTAICGGSAIAAISPVIKAHEKQISVALGTVFILNALALFIFPTIGHWLHLSQKQFGLWSAIAIHDTCSVVGAANKYGAEALEVATTVKLARALWIIPVSLISAVIFKTESKKIKIPYFIGWFVLALVVTTYLPQTALVAPYIVGISKVGLTATLFLIGAGLSKDVLKTVGFRPLVQGTILWVFIAGIALFAVVNYIV
jgi:uncharacterized integral membrane protein (TIGR00698 family)